MQYKEKSPRSEDLGLFSWLGWRDSNPRMHGPKPCALPLGHTPLMPSYSNILKLENLPGEGFFDVLDWRIPSLIKDETLGLLV